MTMLNFTGIEYFSFLVLIVSGNHLLLPMQNATMEENGDEEVMVQCEGLGPIVFSDADDRKFYAGFELSGLIVQVGDCVRVTLQDDKELNSNNTLSCGFAQVLAVYVDSKEEMFVEARWFLQPHELGKSQLKT